MTATSSSLRAASVLWITAGLALAIWHGGITPAWAQSAKKKGTAYVPPPTVEAGLEEAVKWKWRVEPGDAALWGLPMEAQPVSAVPGSPGKASTPTHVPLSPPASPIEYTIEKGDSLTKIGKKFAVTIDQLKLANKMKDDRIVVGQMMHIPSMAEIQVLEREAAQAQAAKAPPAAPGAPKAPVPPPVVRKATVRQLPPSATQAGSVVLLQAYLDRQNFSAGAIDGSEGPLYEAAVKAYEEAYPGVITSADGEVPKALREMGGAYTEYALRMEDFRWIGALQTRITPGKKSSRTSSSSTPEPTFQDLTQGGFLPYRSAWEFVAERFHCSESFLRRINPGVKATPVIGTVFLVPNVEPFEIENALKAPLQPEPDAAAPVTAKIVNLTRLEIRKGDKIVAYLPISSARPGLRGRGTWRVLDAMPHPRMATTGEQASVPKAPVTAGLPDGVAPVAAPVSAAPAGSFTIPQGPNNPVGIIWLNLAKNAEPDVVLPYGLHGTSIPGYMNRQESIGGFRMSNWDIARAMRLLPKGTAIVWSN